MAETVSDDSKKQFGYIMNKRHLIADLSDLDTEEKRLIEAQQNGDLDNETVERKLLINRFQQKRIKSLLEDIDHEYRRWLAQKELVEIQKEIEQAEQITKEALHVQKILNYTIELMTKGYSVDEARKLAEEKYNN